MSVRDFLDADGERWTVAPGRTRHACFIVSARGEQLELYATRGIETITREGFSDHVRIHRLREARRIDDEAAEAERWAAIFTDGREESAPGEGTLQRDRRGRAQTDGVPPWRRTRNEGPFLEASL